MNHGSFYSSELTQMFDSDIISRHVESARENITHLEKYIVAADERRLYLESLTFIPVVELYRHKYSASPVSYNVSLYQYPDIPDGQSNKVYPSGYGKKFGGREKKQAVGYAYQLAEQFHCSVVGNVIK